MNVFFLSGSRNNTRKRLQRVLEYMLPKKNVIIVRTTKDLAANLRQVTSESAVAVILYVSKEKLSELFSMQKLLEGTNIILILHDKDNETVTLGHRLRPRFVTYADSDFLDVASVLIKMKEKIRSENACL